MAEFSEVHSNHLNVGTEPMLLEELFKHPASSGKSGTKKLVVGICLVMRAWLRGQ